MKARWESLRWSGTSCSSGWSASLRPRKRRNLEEYLFRIVLVTLPILPYDSAAAEWHARERARLAGLGRSPAFADGQIAAIAGAHDLTLVTANRADFEPFEGLRIEDWRD